MNTIILVRCNKVICQGMVDGSDSKYTDGVLLDNGIKDMGVIPLEFDGHEDAIFHAFNEEQQQFMEYIRDHGTYADVPVDKIVDAMATAYGHDRIRSWMAAYEDEQQEAPHGKQPPHAGWPAAKTAG